MKQAGAELGQPQLKLWLVCTLIKVCFIPWIIFLHSWKPLQVLKKSLDSLENDLELSLSSLEVPRSTRFYGKINPCPVRKFKVPRSSRFYGKKKPWPVRNFKVPDWSGFYIEIKPWTGWNFKVPDWARFYGKIKPWTAWKFKVPRSTRVS